MKNKISIGNVAINSVVKFPRNVGLFKVVEHKDGYTRLEEILEDKAEMCIFGAATLTVIDWFIVQIVEGF